MYQCEAKRIMLIMSMCAPAVRACVSSNKENEACRSQRKQYDIK